MAESTWNRNALQNSETTSSIKYFIVKKKISLTYCPTSMHSISMILMALLDIPYRNTSQYVLPTLDGLKLMNT